MEENEKRVKTVFTKAGAWLGFAAYVVLAVTLVAILYYLQ